MSTTTPRSATPETSIRTAPDGSLLPAPIRVYLTDDDDQFSLAVSDLLSKQPSVTLVGSANSVEKTLADLATVQADVLVLDLYMREGESLEAIHDLKQARPGIKVLVITGGGWADQQVSSIIAGANGFLYKPFTSSDLAKAIKVLQSGKVYFDASALVEALNPSAPAQQTSEPLSAEDRELLELIRQGLTNTAIADMWKTGIKAVYQRRYRLKTKLGLRSARDLARFAASEWSSSPRGS